MTPARRCLEIYCNPPDEVPDYAEMNPLLFHVAFISTSPDDDSARLIVAGASWVEEIKAPDGTHLIMLRDPWGLALQLCKRAVPLVRGLEVAAAPRYPSGVLIRNRLEDLPALGEPLHLALGVFDGVHIGHQAVIARAVEAAAREGGLAGVADIRSPPDPRDRPEQGSHGAVGNPRSQGPRGRRISACSFSFRCISITDFAKMEASEFIGKLMVAPVRTIAVGEDWRFGHHRSGDVPFLEKEAALRGFKLEAVPPVMHDGDRISSTRIRQAIRDGNLDDAGTNARPTLHRQRHRRRRQKTRPDHRLSDRQSRDRRGPTATRRSLGRPRRTCRMAASSTAWRIWACVRRSDGTVRIA